MLPKCPNPLCNSTTICKLVQGNIIVEKDLEGNVVDLEIVSYINEEGEMWCGKCCDDIPRENNTDR
jgi:hypothetical protein